MRPSSSLKSAVLGAVEAFYITKPLASAFITCGVKASLADMVAQKRAATEVVQTDGSSENDTLILGDIDTPLEKRRNLAFFLYGGLYQVSVFINIRINAILMSDGVQLFHPTSLYLLFSFSVGYGSTDYFQ